MSEPEPSTPIPATDAAGVATATTAGAPPSDSPPPEAQAAAPEPWTPERRREWNAYYDLYVTAGVLFLVFVTSANMIAHSSIWTQLRAGQVMAEAGRPLVRDVFSYSKDNQAWVNIPWVFEWASYLTYKFAHELTPRDPGDLVGSAARAEQVGAGTLVALHALVRVVTALLLLSIRRTGPGLWWSAVCVALALGSILSPVGLVLGGIAAPAQVSPTTWGTLFLATEVLLLFRAIDLGRRGALYALVPLFLVWANVDESFLVGLILLAAAVIGLLDRPAVPSKAGLGSEIQGPHATEPTAAPPRFARGLACWRSGALVCLANPSFHKIFGPNAALTPFATIFQPKGDVRTIDQLSFFGRELQESKDNEWMYVTAYYLIVTAVGLGSFILNLRRFSLSRFLMFAAAAALWAFMIRFGAEFAVVFAATLALNGQEWYQDRFGNQGRLGNGWAVWSVGGRAVTIVLLFLCIAKALTGYGTAPFVGDLIQFGFGFNPDIFAFEAADFLKNAPIKGNVLNTTRPQGDALIWRAYPHQKCYIDDRHNLYDADILREWIEIRNALKTDDVDAWRKWLDRYHISAIMLDADAASRTYERLMQSLNWIPFYDDGTAVMFGRADAGSGDLAYFKRIAWTPMRWCTSRSIRCRRLSDRPRRSPGSTRFSSAAFTLRQPHSAAAGRWLQAGNFDPSVMTMPDPAHCLMAIRQARIALASRPDDHLAYRMLYEAYQILMLEESGLMMGLKLAPESMGQLRGVTPQTSALRTRYQQQVTALNFAIQTGAPPQTAGDRRMLSDLHLRLSSLYMEVGYMDLARDQLREVLDKSAPGDFPADARAQFKDQLDKLTERMKQVEETLQDLTIQRSAGPIELAQAAQQMGAAGEALLKLEEADKTNLRPDVVKPQLVDLYCDTGQPDKALEVLSSISAGEERVLGTDPAGVAGMRRARVYVLLGNYDAAAGLFGKSAIPPLRYQRSFQSLLQTQAFLKGDAKTGTISLEDLPRKVATQAAWEFELGLCLLEAGIPDAVPDSHPIGAAGHLSKALTLSPDTVTRPIIAYYLEKLGKPVPPSSRSKEAAKPKPADAKVDEPKK